MLPYESNSDCFFFPLWRIYQKTYKNLEQRVLLECDGTRIPLPSLQGIVGLNIPSFMGGTNFWGGNKEDDCFIAPSFDDRVLEVVAVFGSVQMAASRIINLQHHRIAQCHSVKITILGINNAINFYSFGLFNYLLLLI